MWFADEAGNPIDETDLLPFNLYSVMETTQKNIRHVIVEPDLFFERYRICTISDIVIGRKTECDICIDSILVSSVHARIVRKTGQWLLVDENSANGVYVNNNRVRNTCVLLPGDVIYIMGFWMIMGKGVLAVGNPDHMITLDKNKFAPHQKKRLHWIKNKDNTSMEYFTPDSNCADRNNSIEQCIDIIENEKSSMWSCSLGQFDFPEIGIGKDRVINLRDYPEIGVKGCMENLLFFCKALLLKLLTYYSYAEVKIIFLLNKEAEREFKTARWIPHIWDNQKQQSFFVRNMSEADQLAVHIKKQYEKKVKSKSDKIPHYIVLGFHRELEKRLVDQGITEDMNIRWILFADSHNETFFRCSIVLEIYKSKSMIYYAAENLRVEFIPDMIKDNMDLLYLQLANTQVDLGMKSCRCENYYMVELYIPVYGNSYDILIPRNDRIGKIIPFIETQIMQQEKDCTILKGNAFLCDREDGIILDEELTPEESGVLNGTRLMLI